MTHNHSLFRSLCTQRWTRACSLAPEARSFWLAFQARPALCMHVFVKVQCSTLASALEDKCFSFFSTDWRWQWWRTSNSAVTAFIAKRPRVAYSCSYVLLVARWSGCGSGTAKKSSRPWHFLCWSSSRNDLECTNLVHWTEALHHFSWRAAIIVVGSALEKHFGGDFTQDREKEITFKRWPPRYQSWKLCLAANGLTKISRENWTDWRERGVEGVWRVKASWQNRYLTNEPTWWWNCLDKKSAIQSDRDIPTHSDFHCV